MSKSVERTEKFLTAPPRSLSAHNVLLVYPESYTVGISNLAHQILWREFNARDEWTCDRLYHAFGNDLCNSMDLDVSPRKFDIIAIPLYYETNLLAVFDFLQKMNIPLLQCDREGKRYPLILTGGPLVDLNPELCREISTLCVRGDFEPMLVAFMELIETHGTVPDTTILENFVSHHSGVMSAHTASSARSYAPRPGDTIPLLSPIVSSKSVFTNTALIEIARGCPHHCTFCHIGAVAKPFRCVDTSRIIEHFEQITHSKITDKVGLISAAVGAHPDIDELCNVAEQLNLKLTFSSVRAEDVTDTMLQTLARSGTKTLSLAPEAGSLRLRKLLGKGALKDDVLIDVIQRGIACGLSHLKIYSMVGLPTETIDDIIELANLLRTIRQLPCLKRSRLTLNTSFYVPKPTAPLHQLMPHIADPKILKSHIRTLNKEIRRIGGVAFTPPSLIEAQVQSAIANSGTAAIRLVQCALKHSGNWREAYREWNKTNS